MVKMHINVKHWPLTKSYERLYHTVTNTKKITVLKYIDKIYRMKYTFD